MRSKYLTALAALLVGALCAVIPALAAPGDTEVLPNAGTPEGQRTDGLPVPPAPLDRTGDKVVLQTGEAVTPENDRNRARELYVRERGVARLRRLTATAQGTEPLGSATDPAISADGRTIAFNTSSPDIAGLPEGHDGSPRILVERPDRSRLAIDPGVRNGPPRLSADGGRIAWAGGRSYSPEDRDGEPDLYVRDLGTGATTLVTRIAGDRGVYQYDLSGDGERVAFITEQPLLPGDTDGDEDVYLARTDGSDLELVTADVAPWSETQAQVRLDADATVVAVETREGGGAELPGEIAVLERRATGWVVADRVAGHDPSLSGDGGLLAFTGARGLLDCAAGTAVDVYALHRATGQVERLSARPDGTIDGAGAGRGASVSGDGRFVSFLTTIPGLAPHDTDRRPDIAVREVGLLEADDRLRMVGVAEPEGTRPAGGERTATARVRLCNPASEDLTVRLTAESASATAGEDFQPFTRTITIPRGSFGADVPVRVAADEEPEPDEALTVRAEVLEPEGVVTVEQATATVDLLDDDGYDLEAEVVYDRNVDVWVSRADGSNARLLATGGRQPALSPDGRRLLFTTNSWESPDLLLLDRDTGVRRSVLPAGQRGESLETPRWLADGSGYVVVRRTGDRFELLEVTNLGGTPVVRVLVARDGWGQQPNDPEPLPDGRVVFGEGNALQAVDRDSGLVRTLAELPVPANPRAVPGGRVLLRNFQGDLLSVDTTTGAHTTVRPERGTLSTFDVGEDGRSLTMSITGGCTGCWALASERLGQPATRRLTHPAEGGLVLRHPDRGPQGAVPVLRRAAVAAREDAGTVTLTWRLSRALPRDLALRITTTGGTATEDDDYAPLELDVTIPAGRRSADVDLAVFDDDDEEGDETIGLRAAFTDPDVVAAVTEDELVLTDDDGGTAGRLSVEDVSATEPADGEAAVEVPVMRTEGTAGPLTAAWELEDGTAVHGRDYAGPRTGTVTVADGADHAAIPVTLLGDAVDEESESFRVRLEGAAVAGGEARVTITDEDPTPELALEDVEGPEGEPYDDEPRTSTVTGRLSTASSRAITVPLTLHAGTAALGEDVVVPDAPRLVFAPGATTATLAVEHAGDDAIEADEAFTVRAGDPVTGLWAVADGEATATLRNDDHQLPPTIAGFADDLVLHDHQDVVLDGDVAAGDPDSAELEEAWIAVGGDDAGDALTYTAPEGSPVTGAWDAARRRLELAGPATPEQWTAALRAVRFATTGDTPARSRTVVLRLSDGEDELRVAKRVEVRRRPRPRVTTDVAGPLARGFDGAGSTDSDGEVVAHHWDFGDGEQAEGATVDHAYDRPGTYTVRLTVTDDEGLTASVERDVRVVAGVLLVRAPGLRQATVDPELGCATGIAGRPDVVAADRCATLATIGGVTYGPAAGGLAEQAYTPLQQGARTGAGTVEDPYELRTTVALGDTGVELEQVDRAVPGQGWWATEVRVRNTAGAAREVVLTRAVHCALDGRDAGRALADPGTGTAGCIAESDATRRLALLPLSPGAAWQAGDAADVLGAVRDGRLPEDRCACAAAVDPAAAVGWRLALAPGAAAARAALTAVPPGGRLPLLATATPDFGEVEPGTEQGLTVAVRNPNPGAAALRQVAVTPSGLGFAYVPGSTSGLATADPEADGATLRWALPAAARVAGGGEAELRLGIRHGDDEGMAGAIGAVAAGGGEAVVGLGDGPALGVRDDARARVEVRAGAAVDTAITGGPSGLTRDPRPVFTVAASRRGAAIECRVGAQPFAPCTSPVTVGPLRDGPHAFEARAVGDPTPARRAFTVDTLAPTTAITAGPAAITRQRDLAFELRSDDGEARFECRLSRAGAEAAWEDCASRAAFAGVADGSYRFDARAVDRAGNADPRGASRQVTVDLTPPETTVERATAPPPPAKAALRLAPSAGDARPALAVEGTAAAVEVACPADGSACRGSIALETGTATLAHERFEVPPGASAPVALDLPLAARNAVEREDELPATAVVRSGGEERREPVVLTPDPLTARLRDAGLSVGAPAGAAPLRLACAADHAGPCTGDVQLTAATATTAAKRKEQAKDDNKGFGTARFSVRPGRQAKVKVRLTARAERTLTRKGRLAVVVRVTTKRAGGPALTKRLTLTLTKKTKKGGRR